MRRVTLAVVPFVLLAACSDQPVAPAASAGRPLFQANQGNVVVHRISVGGPDILGPGGDGNLSLIALQMADGSVQGQWQDASPSLGNLHAVPDCIDISQVTQPSGTVQQAWIGGVVTGPGGDPLVGHRVIIRLRDRGTSANDPPDAISFSLPDPELQGLSSNCHDRPLMGFARVPQGQVTIW